MAEYIEMDLGELLNKGSLPDPVMYQYYKNLNNRKIVINDAIGAEIVEMVILPLLEMDNDGSGEPIEIVLCTCGGSLFDGIALCDVIDNLKCPTTITVITLKISGIIGC